MTHRSKPPRPQPKRRIVFVNGLGFGNYQIQQRKKFLFIPYWSGTHSCRSLSEAASILKYLLTAPQRGDVLFET